MRENEDVAMSSVTKFGSTLQHLPDKLRSNEKIVTAAISSYPRAYKYILKNYNL